MSLRYDSSDACIACCKTVYSKSRASVSGINTHKARACGHAAPILPIDWTYDGEVERQQGACKLCKQPHLGRMHMDHDHVTGRYRGLLCRSCNLTLGHAEKLVGLGILDIDPSCPLHAYLQGA